MSTKIQTAPAALRSRDFFDFNTLKGFCEAHEEAFALGKGVKRVAVDQPAGADFYLFRDNGSNILAVAHLDTCVRHEQRTAVLAQTAGGDVVYSGALDDRLGAYVIADLLPKMGLTFDLLYTVGEEQGMSTAAFFDPADHHDRDYDWIIEFDRGGTDVVLYQYEDETLIERVRSSGARVEEGIFSDISYMEHLGVKAMNWGVGYRDYHTTRGHVWLDDLFKMVDHFLTFHAAFDGVRMPHIPAPEVPWYQRRSSGSGRGSDRGEILVGENRESCDEHMSKYGDECTDEIYDSRYGLLCSEHVAWYID